MKDYLKKLFSVFITFFKIGAFTFGGGYAMIPLIQRETVEHHKWISDDDILDIIAIAESTPGPIAINSATFVGYKVAGFWGSFAATLGVVLPSFIIILTISYVLDAFEKIKAVQFAFKGIRAGVLALIFKALYGMFKKSKKNAVTLSIMACAFLLVAFKIVDSLTVIIACGITGLIFSAIMTRRAKQ